MDTAYKNPFTSSCKGSRGVSDGREKPRGVEEPLPRSLLGQEVVVMAGSSGGLLQRVQDLTVSRGEGWAGALGRNGEGRTGEGEKNGRQ